MSDEPKNPAAQAMRALVKNVRRDTEHYREMARVSAKARQKKAREKRKTAKKDSAQAVSLAGITGTA